jgi:hypothetical protein
VYRDRNNRNHILLCKKLNLKPLLKDLYRHGLRRCRIEAAAFSVEELESVLDSFLRSPDTPVARKGFTLGALGFTEMLQAKRPAGQPLSKFPAQTSGTDMRLFI